MTDKTQLPTWVYFVFGAGALVIFFLMLRLDKVESFYITLLAGGAVSAAYYIFTRINRPKDAFTLQSDLKKLLAVKARPPIFVSPSEIQIDVLTRNDSLAYVPGVGCFRYRDGIWCGAVIPGTLHEVRSRMQKDDVAKKYALAGIKQDGGNYENIPTEFDVLQPDLAD